MTAQIDVVLTTPDGRRCTGTLTAQITINASDSPRAGYGKPSRAWDASELNGACGCSPARGGGYLG